MDDTARFPTFTGFTVPEETTRPLTKQAAMRDLGPVVYVVRTPDGLIKIGFTTDLNKRLSFYKSTAELLCFLPGTLEDEQELHLRFSAQRAKGREWYHEHDELVEWIDGHRFRLGLMSMRRAGEPERHKWYSSRRNQLPHGGTHSRRRAG